MAGTTETQTTTPVAGSRFSEHSFLEPSGDVTKLQSEGDSDGSQTGTPDLKPCDTNEYVTGFKLAIVVASVALACFLMLVDTMVISTASSYLDSFWSR
jgi:hypothetical protein